MNLNNKQLSLIITFCLMGIIVLTAYNINLRGQQEEEFLYELSYDEELLEEIPEEAPPKMTELETHMAYNEANESRYAQELDDFKTLEELKAEIEQLEAEQEESEGEEISELSEELAMAKERLQKQREAMEKLKEKEKSKEPANIRRQTTISYSLKDRYKLEIPNPIYTCESFGTVVINVEVSANGQVIDASFNEKSSTTTNKCLVENAIFYARKAAFNRVALPSKQLGTITYKFQGE